MSDYLKTMLEKAQKYDELMIKTKGYGYDSLCLRYQIARDAQAAFEINQDKKLTGGHKEEQIRSRATRDKVRFCEILHELIGEHD